MKGRIASRRDCYRNALMIGWTAAILFAWLMCLSMHWSCASWGLMALRQRPVGRDTSVAAAQVFRSMAISTGSNRAGGWSVRLVAIWK